MSTVLIVDDDPRVLSSLETFLGSSDRRIITATRGDAALSLVEQEEPDLVVMDVQMPGMDGLATLGRMKEMRPKLPIIAMTGRHSTNATIEAMKRGAVQCLLKPVVPEEMIGTVEAALESVRLMTRHVELDPGTSPPSADAIVGDSKGMQEVYKAIGRVARTDATVLIRGETGTGKELVARAIYQHSRRAERPLVVVNCAAIPETLLESELFGHEKGAFTGATARRAGKFEQADGGTIFLDEIGDMPPTTQAKMLRVLQDRSFSRVGGSEALRADVRVVAATNRDLEEAMSKGRFRDDLYHRLNVFSIDVPPLRERTGDIPKLVGYFIDRFSAELRIERPVLTTAAMELLTTSEWPGNVRELEHCVHRTMIFTSGYPIQPADVRRTLARAGGPGRADPSVGTDAALRRLAKDYLRDHPGPSVYSGFVALMDTYLVAEALRLTRGNRSHAAKLLGISRPTLLAKMRKCSLSHEGEGVGS